MSAVSVVQSRRRRELWVGVFVIFAVAAGVALLFAATDPAVLRGRYHLTLLIDDAQGIRRGDQVRLRGVNIGRIRGFRITREGVAVQLEIDRDYPIPKDSRAVLRGINVLGEMTAEIQPGSSPQMLEDGDVIRGTHGGGVLGQVGSVATEARGALDRVQALLSDSTVDNVEASSAELTDLIRELALLADNLNATAASVADVTSGPELGRTSDNLESLTARLDLVAKTLERTATSAATVMGRIDRGEGALGRLSKDEAIYKNANDTLASVNQAAIELQRLLADVRKNPGRYIKLTVF